MNATRTHSSRARIDQQSPAARQQMRRLVAAVREAVGIHADWATTATLVAERLRRNLPSPDVLTDEQRSGDADTYGSHVLHVEPDGSFSIIALVWGPGQETRIHDHVTWCVMGSIQGTEYEELFTIDGDDLVYVGANTTATGEVTGFAPPGDIHRVRNTGDRTAISIHIYGTDVTRIGSSVRRYYDQPVRGTGGSARS